MDRNLAQALIMGAERVSAWADLLDRINIFPVADGDTGRNLKISLAPLRDLDAGRERTIHRLLVNARGNSGNIAARFFSGLLTAESLKKMPEAVQLGRERAWSAVHDPKPGTILTLFDALAEFMEYAAVEPNERFASMILGRLEDAVRSTPDLLPKLKEAGVVDSGALGMFIFFEGFFDALSGSTVRRMPVTTLFSGLLSVSKSYEIEEENGYCLDVTLDAKERDGEAVRALSGIGESVVVIPGEDYVKVHLHAGDADKVRRSMESVAGIVRWFDDDLAEQVHEFKRLEMDQAIHVMTDAAGSITREDARVYGMTLLDSYVTVGDLSAPETYMQPGEVYAAMRRGVRATTSQASEYERRELYRSVMSRYERVLYVCVGSAYTGNYEAASRWKAENDPKDRFKILDTGAASGRLGSIALAVAGYSNEAESPEEVVEFAKKTVVRCDEYLFIDTLKYLAAGGRLSKTQAFFGNMLGMKPVVTPTAEGVKRASVVKNLEGQIAFALERLRGSAAPGTKPFIMLQFTDNRPLVEDAILPEIAKHYPGANIKIQPLSLTTGVHAGPGTWSIAFIPE
jgi:DegV family protein with EDD domain